MLTGNQWSISQNKKETHMNNLNLLGRIGAGSESGESVIKKANLKTYLNKSVSQQKIDGTYKIVYYF